MPFLMLLAVSSLSAAAIEQSSAEALSERLRSVDPATVTAADCDGQISRAGTLNGPDLFYGAMLCAAANRPVESSFLLNAGQTRAVADLALIVPATRADSEVGTQLYGFIYFQAGGPGHDEVFRDPVMRERFFALLDGWHPAFSEDYDPGWNARRRPEAEAYQNTVEELKTSRRGQLSEVAILYADEIYYALHRHSQELAEQHANSFRAESPEALLMNDLQRQMGERAVALGIHSFGPAQAEGESREARFPPATPAENEVVVSGSDDAVTRRCMDFAERQTIATDSRVVRVLVTTSAEWGTIWRADLGGDGIPAKRLTCTQTTTSSRPLEGPGEALPPLPEGPAGEHPPS